MKSGWQKTTLGEVCQFRGGGTPSKAVERYWHGDIPWVSPKDMKFDVVSDSIDHISQEAIEGSATSLIPKDSVLMVVRSGILARTVPIAITGRDLTINQDLKALCPNGAMDARFLYHLLDSKMDELLSMVSRGATVHRLMTEQIRALDFVLPPLPEQEWIVGILDEAFAGITTAKANAEKNLQNARALFELQLVTTLRRGGEGWVETTIGDVCTLKSGTTVPVKLERPTGDIPYVKVAEMTMPANHDGVTTSIRFLNKSEIKPGWVIPAGAAIFPKRGGAILTNKKRLALVDMCADLNIMSVIPSDRLTPDFLYLYFLTVDMRKLGTGSSIPQINNYDIAPLLIFFPESKAKQIEITEALRAIEAECKVLAATYERKLAALDALKKSMLHEAFTGQLTATT